MPVSPELEDYIVGQLEAAGTIRVKRMFGGVGLYLDDVFCAIIGGGSGRLYLKVDDSNRPDYERESMEPFRTPKGTMSYYTVPEHVIDDALTLRDWVLKARAVAVGAGPARKRRRT
jgi:DNA transformation protein